MSDLNIMAGIGIGDTPFWVAALIVVGALWLDYWLGEPNKYHPLVGFGAFANAVEKRCRSFSALNVRLQGVLAWSVSVLPWVAICYLALGEIESLSPSLWLVLNIVILSMTIGGRSLLDHAQAIFVPLQAGDLESARYAVSMIVSRNTDKMGEKEMASSAIESVLENGNDAVFAPIVWFLVLGAPGAVLFRLANTLDAMWGYKTERYLHFGWCAARIDDVLGWAPARVTALFYAIQGSFFTALRCWRQQARQCSSPNGGVVMTAGAGALKVIIGGPTYYHGVLHDKKPLGIGSVATWREIPLANQLVFRGSLYFSHGLLIMAWLCR